jgi:transposase
MKVRLGRDRAVTFMKRLERGRFADLWGGGGGAPVKLTSSELALYIEGCTLVGRQALSPTEITLKSLALVDRA